MTKTEHDPDYNPVGTGRYGDAYWCIKTPQSQDGEVYLMADRLEVDPSGALLCIGHFRTNEREEAQRPYIAFAAGQWTAFYAASVIDGAPVSVDHWMGEVVSRKK